MKITKSLSRKSGVAILLVTIVVLALGKEFFIPVVLAALLSLFLTPTVRWLVRKGVPDFLAIVTCVVSMMLTLGALAWCIAGQAEAILADLPKYRNNLHDRIASFRNQPDGTIARAGAAIADIRQEISGAPPSAAAHPGDPQDGRTVPNSQKTAPSGPEAPVRAVPVASPAPAEPFKWGDTLSLAITALTPFATGSAVLLFSIFMLLQREDIHDRFIMLSGTMAGKHNMRRSAEALEETFARISKYLVMQILTNGMTGMVIGAILWPLGVPHAFLWGLLAALLRSIPYIGMVIAAVLTVVFAVATSPDLALPSVVLGVFVVVELTVSNVLEPLLYGHGTGLSSLAILITAAFWACIWGLPGLFLSVPLTVCLVVIGKHVPFLDFLETLLCDRASLPKDSLLYHRLLGMQRGVMQEEIDKLCRGLHAARSFDLVYLPTLRIAEKELEFERISPERFSGLLESMSVAVEDLSTTVDAPPVQAEDPPAADAGTAVNEAPPSKVVCIAAHGELDKLMTGMIVRALRGPTLNMLDFTSGVTAEAIALINREGIAAVVVASASDTSTMTAISWCRVLRASFPQLPIIGCAWDEEPGTENRMELVRERRGIRMCSSISALPELLNEVSVRDREAVPASA